MTARVVAVLALRGAEFVCALAALVFCVVSLVESLIDKRRVDQGRSNGWKRVCARNLVYGDALRLAMAVCLLCDSLVMGWWSIENVTPHLDLTADPFFDLLLALALLVNTFWVRRFRRIILEFD